MGLPRGADQVKKHTIRECLIAALIERGEVRVTTNATKYTVFTRTYGIARNVAGALVRAERHGRFYYVGAAGALRVGETVKGSMSMEHVRPILVAEGRKILESKQGETK